MTWVNIERGVTFCPANGVLIETAALDLTSEELRDAIHLAFFHINDEILRMASNAGCGPLGDVFELPFEEYLTAHKKHETEKKKELATRSAKSAHSNMRRKEFNSSRSQLILKMIEAGTQYFCAVTGCEECVDLTIDHIVPLSKGGSDDLENLQFMCRPHNSSKGDR